MGRFGQDVKNLILGNDGSDKEPLDFKTELQSAIKAGLITKADGTLLITSRTNIDELAKIIEKEEEKEVVEADKKSDIEFNPVEEELEYRKEKEKKKKEKERQKKVQEKSLEQQIEASKRATKAKMNAEKDLENEKERERK